MSTMVIRVPSKDARYVAIRSGRDHEVVAHGKNWKETRRKAREAGCPNAAMMWIPDPKKRYVF